MVIINPLTDLLPRDVTPGRRAGVDGAPDGGPH